jgi:hypothetical protein
MGFLAPRRIPVGAGRPSLAAMAVWSIPASAIGHRQLRRAEHTFSPNRPTVSSKLPGCARAPE